VSSVAMRAFPRYVALVPKHTATLGCLASRRESPRLRDHRHRALVMAVAAITGESRKCGDSERVVTNKIRGGARASWFERVYARRPCRADCPCRGPFLEPALGYSAGRCAMPTNSRTIISYVLRLLHSATSREPTALNDLTRGEAEAEDGVGERWLIRRPRAPLPRRVWDYRGGGGVIRTTPGSTSRGTKSRRGGCVGPRS
jgi:hypothetical protein